MSSDMATAEQLRVTKEWVQKVLADWLGTIEVDVDGDFTVPLESARAFIRVLPWREGKTVVRIWCIVNQQVPKSEDLFHFIATQADDFIFGALSAHEREDGTVTVHFAHSLLGDTMDSEELKTGVRAVLTTAEALDDQISGRFGGRRFHDPA